MAMWNLWIHDVCGHTICVSMLHMHTQGEYAHMVVVHVCLVLFFQLRT